VHNLSHWYVESLRLQDNERSRLDCYTLSFVAKRPTLHLRRDKPAVTDNTERERIHEVTDNA
jgi:hypothetical protein